MKLKTLKPLYLGGKTLVEGTPFLTSEQHGRELLKKGYAEADESRDEAAVDLTESETSTDPLTSKPVDPKATPKGKATEKKKAD